MPRAPRRLSMASSIARSHLGEIAAAAERRHEQWGARAGGFHRRQRLRCIVVEFAARRREVQAHDAPAKHAVVEGEIGGADGQQQQRALGMAEVQHVVE